MKKRISIALLLTAVFFPAWADTAFPMNKTVVESNRKKVEAFRKEAYWKTAPFAVAAVDPLSYLRRDPSVFPADGNFTDGIRLYAAQNEYEGGSVVLYGFNDVADVLLVPGDLRGPKGAVLKASEIDTKVVKVWYQQGTAWGGFFSDPLRRIATPELMLYDDALVEVNHETKENYLRCDYGAAGTTEYRWVSFNGAIVDHSYDGGIRNEWIHDANTLQPFMVRKDEFKQLIFTVHVPSAQEPGIYKGTIAAQVKGAKVCDIPVVLRVFPFELPLPKAFYNAEKPFMVSPYMGGINLYDCEKLAANMVRHNVRNCLLPQIRTPSEAKKAYDMMKRVGFDTEHLLTALPGCGLMTSYPAKETDKNYAKFVSMMEDAKTSMESIRSVFGEDANVYSYGIDEGSAATVRKERATWEGIHRLGGKTVVATRWHPYILFNLDYANVPRHPRAAKKADADAFHAANPDGIFGWYADPHSGPENPDYTRRIYGWQGWRNNYDGSCQYILFRDNWNDFWIPAEAFLRGLMLVYPQDQDILDTIEWEGVREGMDDVRYGTLLKQLAEKARLSKDVATSYAGRAALSWVSQVDYEHSTLEYLRLEMAARIMDLQDRLAKE